MPKSSPWPEIIISDTRNRTAISRAVARGELRRLAPKLYTRNLEDPPSAIVRRHLWDIVGSLVPGAMIADRTALELKPAGDGSVFIISDRKRALALPGIIVRPRKARRLPQDRPFLNGLYISSQPRAYLENLRVSRPRAGQAPRTLCRQELEDRLESMFRQAGPQALARLRDEARALAPTLGLDKEFTQLDALIGALFGTRQAKLTSRAASARGKGEPFDPVRVEAFEELHRALFASAPASRPAPPATESLAFYEAYFSNFIEGTEFAVAEAEEIIFEAKMPIDRPADAHDILSTYAVVSNHTEMHKRPRRFEELLALLKQRHAVIMAQRSDKQPGSFKTEVNRAGSTVFVSPELVEGTLKKGYEIYQNLDAPFHRAVFIMFLVAEVHPFADGNGRLARIMMNAELAAEGEQRIIIPTVYRNNYLAALKALTHHRQPSSLIRVLDFAQRYTASVDWSDRAVSRYLLEATHAFVDPNDADIEGLRLTLPDDPLLAEAWAALMRPRV